MIDPLLLAVALGPLAASVPTAPAVRAPLAAPPARATGSTQDPDERSSRWIDVRDLLDARLEDAGGVPGLRPGEVRLGESEPAGYDVELNDPRWQPTTDDLVLLLEEVLFDALDDGAELQARGGLLEFVATADEHARALRFLDELRAHLGRELAFEVYPLEAVPEDWDAVLSAAQVDAWLAATGAVPRREARGPVARRVHVGAESAEAVVADYASSANTFSLTTDPQVSRAVEGFQLGAQVHVLTDGRLFVRAWELAARRVGDLRQVPFGREDSHALQLPVVDGTRSLCSAVLEDGGGLVVARSARAGGAHLLRVRRGASGDLPEGWLPIGLVTAPSLRRAPTPMVGTPVSGEGEELVRLPEEGFEGGPGAPVELEELTEMLTDEGDGWITWMPLHGVVAPVERGEDVQPARARLAGLEAVLGRTVCCEVRYGLLEPAAWAELRAASAEPADWLAPLDQRWLLAARSGDDASSEDLRTTWYLADYDVRTSPGNPIVEPAERGARLWLRPTVRDDGSVAAWVQLGVSEEVRPLERRPVRFLVNGLRDEDDDLLDESAVELPHLAGLERLNHVQAEADTWVPLAVEHVPGIDRHLVALVRFRVR